MKSLLRSMLIGLVCAALPSLRAGAAPEPPKSTQATVTVFAAASLKNALDDVKAAWEKNTGNSAVLNYAGSNVLAKQIEQGAPADLFVSADREWMQYVSDKGLTVKSSERDLLGNRLVLVAPQTSTLKLKIAPGFALAAALGDGKLAMCNPAVPAGQYGVASLQSLGVWDHVSAQVAQAENVRAALALVARGEAPLGIVYATDANAEPAVRIVGEFPENSHPPIVYSAALLRDSQQPAAKALLAFMESPAARPLFEKQGFTVLAH